MPNLLVGPDPFKAVLPQVPGLFEHARDTSTPPDDTSAEGADASGYTEVPADGGLAAVTGSGNAPVVQGPLAVSPPIPTVLDDIREMLDQIEGIPLDRRINESYAQGFGFLLQRCSHLLTEDDILRLLKVHLRFGMWEDIIGERLGQIQDDAFVNRFLEKVVAAGPSQSRTNLLIDFATRRPQFFTVDLARHVLPLLPEHDSSSIKTFFGARRDLLPALVPDILKLADSPQVDRLIYRPAIIRDIFELSETCEELRNALLPWMFETDGRIEEFFFGDFMYKVNNSRKYARQVLPRLVEMAKTDARVSGALSRLSRGATTSSFYPWTWAPYVLPELIESAGDNWAIAAIVSAVLDHAKPKQVPALIAAAKKRTSSELGIGKLGDVFKGNERVLKLILRELVSAINDEQLDAMTRNALASKLNYILRTPEALALVTKDHVHGIKNAVSKTPFAVKVLEGLLMRKWDLFSDEPPPEMPEKLGITDPMDRHSFELSLRWFFWGRSARG